MSKLLLDYLHREYAKLKELIERETHKQPIDEALTRRLQKLDVLVERQIRQFEADATFAG